MIRANPIVVGAGVIGLTTAWLLRRAGYRPLVLDAGEPARESSWAGGGIVCPVPPWRYPQPVNALVERSRSLYPDLVGELQQASRVDCEYWRSGLLLVGEMLEQGHAWLSARQPRAEFGQVADFEPEFEPRTAPAALLADIPQLRNPRLAQALLGALRRHDVVVRGHAPVERIEFANGRVAAVMLANGDRVAAADVIVAAGAWTDRLLEASGLAGLGIEPVRGQMLLFNPGRRLLRHMVNHGRGYLIPRRDGRILAGSSAERVGFDRRPQQAFYRDALGMARACLPALRESQIECHWLGFRPGIRADLPAIGAYPGVAGLWLNAGHFRNGLGMAPAAAELLIQRMRSGVPGLAFGVAPMQG